MQRPNQPPVINTIEYETLVLVRGVTAIINLGSVQPNFPALPQLPVSPVEASRFLELNFARVCSLETPALYTNFIASQWPLGITHPRGMHSASVISPGPNLQLILPQDPASDQVSYWRPSEAQYGAAKFAEGLRLQADHLARDQRGVLIARELLRSHYIEYTAGLRDGAAARPDPMSGDRPGDCTAASCTGRTITSSRSGSPSGVAIHLASPDAPAHRQPEEFPRDTAASAADGSHLAPTDAGRSFQPTSQPDGGQHQPNCPTEARDTPLVIADDDVNAGRPAYAYYDSYQRGDSGSVLDGPPPTKRARATTGAGRPRTPTWSPPSPSTAQQRPVAVRLRGLVLSSSRRRCNASAVPFNFAAYLAKNHIGWFWRVVHR